METIDIVTASIAGIALLMVGFVGASTPKRAATWQRMGKLEERLERFENLRENDLDYIGILKHHIWTELPPPPPDRPIVIRAATATAGAHREQ